LSRKKAREMAVQLLYQLEIQKDDVQEQIDQFVEQDAQDNNDNSYIKNTVSGIIENKEEIDKIIESYAKDWTISRIAKVDLSILRLAVFELTKASGIPQNVAINEAVELAKTFGTEESGRFVNGILGSLVKKDIEGL
jgi:N utilization substance protein B